jgi:hypothetical protein
MLHADSFNLGDSMSALEMMDPKMDAGLPNSSVKQAGAYRRAWAPAPSTPSPSSPLSAKAPPTTQPTPKPTPTQKSKPKSETKPKHPRLLFFSHPHTMITQ